MQQETPKDFVIATGIQHSVRDLVEKAASVLGLSLTWVGKGIEEKGVLDTGNCIVRVDPRYFRPTEVEALVGDPSLAGRVLGWRPKKSFSELVEEMVHADLVFAKQDELSRQHGYPTLNYHE